MNIWVDLLFSLHGWIQSEDKMWTGTICSDASICGYFHLVCSISSKRISSQSLTSFFERTIICFDLQGLLQLFGRRGENKELA